MYKIAREEVTELRQSMPLAGRITLVLIGAPAGVFLLSFAATLAWFACTAGRGTLTAFDRAVMEVLGGTAMISLATLVVMLFVVAAGACFGVAIKGLLAQGE